MVLIYFPNPPWTTWAMGTNPHRLPRPELSLYIIFQVCKHSQVHTLFKFKLSINMINLTLDVLCMLSYELTPKFECFEVFLHECDCVTVLTPIICLGPSWDSCKFSGTLQKFDQESLDSWKF